MAHITKFGVLSIYRTLAGKVAPLRVIDVRTADDARRTAGLLALVVGGAIAFSKTDGDPAQVLSCCGEVPEGFELNPKAMELDLA